MRVAGIPIGGILQRRVNQSCFSGARYKILGGVVYFVYMLSPYADSPVKVGYTQRPKSRLSTLQSASPYPLQLLGALLVPDGEECPVFERKVKDYLSGEQSMNGEWYDIQLSRMLELIDQMGEEFGVQVITPKEIQDKWL